MSKKIVVRMVTLTMALGWVFWGSMSAQAVVEQKGTPVIIASFASKELRPGDVWKVYLKASDPEGKMRYIFATISQPGVGIYPVSITRIKEENRKELSGYLYLNTAPARVTQFFNRSLTLTVNIKGEGSQFSEPAVFPLFFQAQPTQEGPLEGVFKEQKLGPIMVTLKSGIRR